jgi:hypothetical protein
VAIPQPHPPLLQQVFCLALTDPQDTPSRLMCRLKRPRNVLDPAAWHLIGRLTLPSLEQSPPGSSMFLHADNGTHHTTHPEPHPYPSPPVSQWPRVSALTHAAICTWTPIQLQRPSFLNTDAGLSDSITFLFLFSLCISGSPNSVDTGRLFFFSCPRAAPWEVSLVGVGIT